MLPDHIQSALDTAAADATQEQFAAVTACEMLARADGAAYHDSHADMADWLNATQAAHPEFVS
jgi:hypothetical protein